MQKQVFRKCSTTNITGVKVDLKRCTIHNVCTNVDLASKLFHLYFSSFQKMDK